MGGCTLYGLTLLAGILAIIESLEVWGTGFTLVTLLNQNFHYLWNTTETNGSQILPDFVERYQNIGDSEAYYYIIIGFLSFYTFFLLTTIALLWANEKQKETPFVVWVVANTITLLLSVVSSIYFLIQNSKEAFDIFTGTKKTVDEALPYFLIFLFMSRGFIIWWIVKVILMCFVSQRRLDFEDDKVKNLQKFVDEEFGSIYDRDPRDSIAPCARLGSIPTINLPRVMIPERPPSPTTDYTVDMKDMNANDYNRPPEGVLYRSHGVDNLAYQHDDRIPNGKRHDAQARRSVPVVHYPTRRQSGMANGGPQQMNRPLPETPRQDYWSPQAQTPRTDTSFQYGPGPAGYSVPSLHAAPELNSMPPVESSDYLPASFDFYPPASVDSHQQSNHNVVRRLSSKFERNHVGGLRSGPPPVGGVPAVGPASRRDINDVYY